MTKLAKAGFRADLEDLYNRGARIIRESVQYGVTSMRAHVEVDTSVEFACLEAAQRLQRDYRTQCDVQIASMPCLYSLRTLRADIPQSSPRNHSLPQRMTQNRARTSLF